MTKNEIHARLSPEVMEEIRRWTDKWEFSTISHTVRRLLELGLKVANDEQHEKLLNSAGVNTPAESLMASSEATNESNEDNLIEW